MNGPPVQSRVAAANRAVIAACAMILAHMVMNRGQMQNRTGAAGMGPRQRQAGKTRPLVKLTGTGLVAKTAGR